jgi:hypothetical protein
MSDQKSIADRIFPEVNDAEETEIRNIPPEQRRLHTETSDLTILSLKQFMDQGKIEIPDFQRGYVWNRKQASRLIESLIIQCPIPVIYFSQSPSNKLVVIDGNQRLLSIKLFLEDLYDLQGLSTYPELNSNTWSTLDPRFRDHIESRTLRCITILKDTHPQIKFEVFERLNTGSVKLNAQEIRHGINHSTLMKRIDTLSKTEPWRKISGISSDKRMKGSELILRFFAFFERSDSYSKPLSSFLDQYSSDAKSYRQDKVDLLCDLFVDVIDRIHFALDKESFRIFDNSLKSITPFNAALYDAQMFAFSKTRNKVILEGTYDPSRLKEHVFKLFLNENFMNSIRQATSDELSVKNRLRQFHSHIEKFNGL